MARTLTTPDPQPDAVQQHISSIRFEVPAIRNAGDTAMEISKPQVHLWFEVITYAADGSIVDKQTQRAPFKVYDTSDPPVLINNWPPAFITDVKEVYARVEAYAESLGLIVGPGTDEPLE